MWWNRLFALRGSRIKPDEDILKQYKDLQEAQEDMAILRKQGAEHLRDFKNELKALSSGPIGGGIPNSSSSPANTAELLFKRDQELYAVLKNLHKRVQYIEEVQFNAETRKWEAYEKIRQTGNQLACGGLAGAIARTTVAPIDRVKILMQTQHIQLQGKEQKYTGIVQALQTIVREEGFQRLWRGNATNIFRVIPYSATQFASYDFYKGLMTEEGSSGHLSIPQKLGAGALAGMTATTVTHPLDVIRLRLSVNPDLKGPMHAFRDVISENGARSLMKGYTPTLLSLGPFIAINFASFDALKQWYYPQPEPGKPRVKKNPWTILMLGAGAGLFAQTCCYPLDTIRRRMQLKGHPYKSTLDCITTITKSEGITGFYKGMVPNAIKVIPNNSIRFMAFEMLRQYFGIKKKER